MPDSALQARRLLIHGHVQGVSYRAYACAEARRLGLAGWVRNRSDGSVEALVAGPEAVVVRFIEWTRSGPPHARVTRVEVVAAQPPAPGFTILPDA